MTASFFYSLLITKIAPCLTCTLCTYLSMRLKFMVKIANM